MSHQFLHKNQTYFKKFLHIFYVFTNNLHTFAWQDILNSTIFTTVYMNYVTNMGYTQKIFFAVLYLIIIIIL
jgi:hypothetical protein